MADEQAPQNRKKVPPVALIGAVVAIFAGLGTVFIATNGKDKPVTPEAQQPAEIAGTEDAVVQTAQFGDDQPALPTPPTPGEAVAVMPDASALSLSDETISASAAIPEGPANDPVLAALRKEAAAHIARRKAEARTNYDEFKKTGATSPAWPWEVMIKWDYTAKAGDIVSLFGSSYEFTGGAHGMTFFDTHVARTSGQQLKVVDMLKGGLTPALTIGICEALKAQKAARTNTATIFDDPITCAGPNANIAIDSVKLALAPSDQPNKFGGIQAYYQAYEVGAYAEGSYELVVQQDVFAEDLKPEFKPLFAGKAPPIEN